MEFTPNTDPDPGADTGAGEELEQAARRESEWASRINRWGEQVDLGLAQNDAMIRSATIDQGWEIAAHRAAVFTPVIREFFEAVIEELPPNGSVAVYQLGGTGRGEMCPDSDLDLGVIVENVDDDETFLENLVARRRLLLEAVPIVGDVLKTNSFHDLRNRNHFDLNMMRSMLDGELMVGNLDFHHRIQKACHEQGYDLNLEIVFETIRQIQEFDDKHPQMPGDVSGFHIKDGRGGQRNFQLPIWMHGFEHWVPSKTVYELGQAGMPGAPGEEARSAAGVLLLARSWLALRRKETTKPGTFRPKYTMTMSDMHAFHERFGDEGVKRLNQARNEILHYREDAIGHMLEQGVVVPDTDGIVRYRSAGLSLQGSAGQLPFEDVSDADATTRFFQLYLAAKQFDIPIERATVRALRDAAKLQVQQHPIFLEIMGSTGELASTLHQWRGMGLMNRIVPGFDDLSESFYDPEHRNASLMKDARAIQRIENLDLLEQVRPEGADELREFFHEQLQAIGVQGLIAVRLALLMEEIPDTKYEGGKQYEQSVWKYLDELRDFPGMSEGTLAMTGFLIQYKRRLLSSIEQSADPSVLGSWQADIESLHSENRADAARALALFAYAAFDFEPADRRLRGRLSEIQWMKVRTLCENLIHSSEGVGGDSFLPEYFDEAGRRIGAALPESLKNGPMLTKMVKRFGEKEWDPKRAHPVIEDLKRVLKTGEAQLQLSKKSDFCELALFGFNQPGLFWKVAGVLHEMDVKIRFTELYPLNAVDEPEDDLDEAIGQLVVDLITFDVPGRNWNADWREQLLSRLQERILESAENIPDDTPELLQRAAHEMRPKLTQLRDGRYKFSFQSPEHDHMLYAVSRNLSERVDADIYSVSDDGTHDWTVPRLNVYFRSNFDTETITERLGAVFEGMRFIGEEVGGRFQTGERDELWH